MNQKAINAALDAAIFSVWTESSVRKSGVGKRDMRITELRQLALFLYVWGDDLKLITKDTGLTQAKLKKLQVAVDKQNIDYRGLYLY